MKAKTIIFLFLFSINLSGQNLIMNNGFELSSDCPTNVSQIDLLENWEDIVISSDFYDCELTLSFYPTNSFANSGTGYVSFSSYGDTNGSSEAIGQTLSTPLHPNKTYNLKVAGKKSNGGIFSSTCGGIAIYGFTATNQDATSNTHISQYDDVKFLGLTDIVSNEEWLDFDVEINPEDTINYIVFTVEQVPDCAQCTFIDDIILELDISSNIDEFDTTLFDVYPNPFQSTLRLDYEKKETIILIEMYNELGQSVFVNNEFKDEVDVSYLSKGIYFLKATDESGNIFTKKIIKSN